MKRTARSMASAAIVFSGADEEEEEGDGDWDRVRSQMGVSFCAAMLSSLARRSSSVRLLGLRRIGGMLYQRWRVWKMAACAASGPETRKRKFQNFTPKSNFTIYLPYPRHTITKRNGVS